MPPQLSRLHSCRDGSAVSLEAVQLARPAEFAAAAHESGFTRYSRPMVPELRAATIHDLARINEIYNAYIVDTHTSFDTQPWSMAARTAWFERYRQPGGRYQVLVAAAEQRVVGFAASSPFRQKVAYDSSVETTVVLEEVSTGEGFGTALLGELLARLRIEGVHRAYALIALPNTPSRKAHMQLGYQTVGVLNEVGHKLGQFHSVELMEFRF